MINPFFSKRNSTNEMRTNTMTKILQKLEINLGGALNNSRCSSQFQRSRTNSICYGKESPSPAFRSKLATRATDYTQTPLTPFEIKDKTPLE